MKKKSKVTIIVVCVCATVFGAWILFSGVLKPNYPDTLTPGHLPTIYLPINNFSRVDMIQGYGQITPDYFHPGIDIQVNNTTPIVAPCNAYVSLIQPNYYNEIANVYQTNIQLSLNDQWTILISFESSAANATFGAYQVGNISLTLGQYVTTNQSIGNLLQQGPNARIHFGIKSYEIWECPYRFFCCSARLTFEEQFARVGVPLACGEFCYCCD